MPYTPTDAAARMYSTATGRSVSCSGVTREVNGIRTAGPNGITANTSSLLVFAVIPFGPAVRIPFTSLVTPLQLTDLPVAVLYILAAASVGVYGIVLGGWSSGSTYPLLGAVRSTAQVISYELAMGLSLVSVFLLAGSMSTSQISTRNGSSGGRSHCCRPSSSTSSR